MPLQVYYCARRRASVATNRCIAALVGEHQSLLCLYRYITALVGEHQSLLCLYRCIAALVGEHQSLLCLYRYITTLVGEHQSLLCLYRCIAALVGEHQSLLCLYRCIAALVGEHQSLLCLYRYITTLVGEHQSLLCLYRCIAALVGEHQSLLCLYRCIAALVGEHQSLLCLLSNQLRSSILPLETGPVSGTSRNAPRFQGAGKTPDAISIFLLTCPMMDISRKELRWLEKLGLHFNEPEHAILCTRCGFALNPQSDRVSRHLREKHDISKKERWGLNQFIRSLRLQDPALLPLRVDGSRPHPHLALQRGSACKHCGLRSVSEKVLADHVRKEHEDKVERVGRQQTRHWLHDHIRQGISFQSWAVSDIKRSWIVVTDDPLEIKRHNTNCSQRSPRTGPG
ncbi:hypothetical protein NCS56_01223000 [Fusarium sp. Ph1]|nr:hypothetical protein NCS56_01223000 [Fusarium sp. Ph1]